MLAVLAEELGLAASGGTFGTYLLRLVSNSLAIRFPDGGVRAAGELFPTTAPLAAPRHPAGTNETLSEYA